MELVHLQLKKKLRTVGLFGDACVSATGAQRQELKAWLLIVGRSVTLETRQDITSEALKDIEATSSTQRVMLLDLFGKLLARPSLKWNQGKAYDAWQAEYGQAANTLYSEEVST
jgi:hypothetical protein